MQERKKINARNFWYIFDDQTFTECQIIGNIVVWNAIKCLDKLKQGWPQKVSKHYCLKLFGSNSTLFGFWLQKGAAKIKTDQQNINDQLPGARKLNITSNHLIRLKHFRQTVRICPIQQMDKASSNDRDKIVIA